MAPKGARGSQHDQLNSSHGTWLKKHTQFFLLFRHTAQHAGSEFPDKQSLNHWTTKEVLVPSLFFFFFFKFYFIFKLYIIVLVLPNINTVLTSVIKFMALRPEQAPSSALNTRKVHSTWEHWGPSSAPRGAVLGQRARDFYTALYK